MLRLALLAMMFYFVTRGARADDCTVLHAVIDATSGGFDSIRGSSMPDDRWRTKLELSAYGSCEIVRNGQMQFQCKTPSQQDEQTAIRFSQDQRAATAACLGTSWIDIEPVLKGSFSFVNTTAHVSVAALVTRLVDSSDVGNFHVGYGVIFWINQFEPVPPAIPPEAGTQVTPRRDAIDYDTICNPLKEILAHSENEFAAIKGRVIGEEWMTKVAFEAADSCNINRFVDGSLTYHHCQFGGLSDRDEAMNVAKTMTTAVRSCLDSTWHQTRQRRTNGTITYGFENPSEYAEVEIRPSKQRSGWQVNLDVNLAKH